MKLKPENEILSQEKLRLLVYSLYHMGFPDIAEKYAEEIYKIHGDSIRHLYLLAFIDHSHGAFTKGEDKMLKLHLSDTTNLRYVFWLMEFYVHTHSYQEAFKYAQLFDKMRIEQTREKEPNTFKGYLYKTVWIRKQCGILMGF